MGMIKKRERWRWLLVAILCWVISMYSSDVGLRSVLLGLGMYFNVVLIEKYVSKQKYDCFIVRLLSAAAFMLPSVGVTLLLLNHYSPKDLNGTKTILLLSPIIYGTMFYLGVYISEKLKSPSWLSFLIILLFMYGAGVFRLSGLLKYPELYAFTFTSAFGLVSMLTCIVCGGLFLRTMNVTAFSGLMVVGFVIGFFCNSSYGMSYRRFVFEVDKHHPEILKKMNYTLAVKDSDDKNDLLFIFNNAGFISDNFKIKNDNIYNKTTDRKVAKLISERKDCHLVIDLDWELKFDRELSRIYLKNRKDKRNISIANGHSPSYAEDIKRIFYINDGKVYSRNLSGKDEVFYCMIDQPGKGNWHSFSFVSPDGKYLLYDGPHMPFAGVSIMAVLQLSSGKSHLIPREYLWETSRFALKAWLNNKLLNQEVRQ